MLRLDVLLLVICTLAWVTASLVFTGVLPWAGWIPLDLYRFYSIAAVLGWLTGNVYKFRRQSSRGQQPSASASSEPASRRALLGYLTGPPSFIYLIRSLAPVTAQEAAPFVALYAHVIFYLFFLVPMTLGVRQIPRRPADP